jgi:hypothetical protein
MGEQYIDAFSNIAKQSTTLLLPSNASEPSSMMAQALTVYKNMIGNVPRDGQVSFRTRTIKDYKLGLSVLSAGVICFISLS